MNYKHLNIFRFYNESEETNYIENNLSRAFAICLKNNNLFLSEYLLSIINIEDYKYLFNSSISDDEFSLDLQKDMSTIEAEGIQKVYAIAMTANKSLDMTGFLDSDKFGDRKSITDIYFTIKDIAFVIEVKRNHEDCKTQLYNQIRVFQDPNIKTKVEIIPKSKSWPEVVSIMDNVQNLSKITKNQCPFITDFLKLSEYRFSDWFEPKPFNVLSFSINNQSKDYQQLRKRMQEALNKSSYDLLEYSDRLGVKVDFGWASEVSPVFHSYENQKKDFIAFYIWPGNTKRQGYSIYNKSLDWINKKTMNIDGNDYELEIDYSIKLCHFNRHVAGINYTTDEIGAKTHTRDNFYNKSGKWHRDAWPDLEAFFDTYFTDEFDWRGYCNWQESFINTDRNYLTMSLGFEVCVFIPYAEFQSIDLKNEDIDHVSKKINSIVNAFSKLLN